MAVPNTPSSWQAYFAGHDVSKLPQITGSSDDGHKMIHRAAYIDLSDPKLLQTTAKVIWLFADVIAISQPATVISLNSGTMLNVFARVLTADAPTTAKFTTVGHGSCTFALYASQLDQAIQISVGGGIIQIALGNDSGHQGLVLRLDDNVTNAAPTYLPQPPSLDLTTHALSQWLMTESRMAAVLFWTDLPMALSIATYVAMFTSKTPAALSLHLQAQSLVSQASAILSAGPNVAYMPPLSLDSYQTVLDRLISLADNYEKQYDRFVDRSASLADQKAAWQSMLDQAQTVAQTQTQAANDTLAKYHASMDVLLSTLTNMQDGQDDLREAASDFKLGISAWQEKEAIEATLNILMTVVTFALSVGAALVGMPTEEVAAGAVVEAADAASTLAKVASSANTIVKAFMKKDTIEAIAKLAEATAKLTESTIDLVGKVQDLQTNPNATISNMPSNADDTADITQLEEIAAWDRWALESDNQMEFAVSQDIEGASQYRLALRKHAIDGKLVCQARAQQVQTGQAYAQAVYQLMQANANVQSLQGLLQTFNGEQEVLAQAQSGFYDSLLQQRVSIAVQMNDVMMAYRYATLQDSGVALDPLRDDVRSFEADINNIVTKLQTYQSTMSSDFAAYRLPFDTDDLGLDYGAAISQSLRKDGTASFTLTPPAFLGTSLTALGPFAHGAHVRTKGMRAWVKGAKPRTGPSSTKPTVAVQLHITTSGIYTDVANGQAYTFTSMPLSRRFQYGLNADGTAIDPPLVDSIVDSTVHVDPTPFTQWRIKVENFADLDLSAATGLKLYWEGSADFSS